MANVQRDALRGRRAEKKDRLETLRLRASSQLTQIRRQLGGQYVEDITEVDVEAASDTMGQLRDTVKEARTLMAQIDELTELIEG